MEKCAYFEKEWPTYILLIDAAPKWLFCFFVMLVSKFYILDQRQVLLWVHFRVRAQNCFRAIAQKMPLGLSNLVMDQQNNCSKHVNASHLLQK